MLIGYTPREVIGPANVTGAVTTSATWLTADGGAALFDGKPARKARLQWPAGTPLVTQYVAISATLQVHVALRVLALLGTTLPVGCRVDFLGAGSDGLGGSCDNARTVRMPDGTVGVWAVAREDDALETGVEIRIYNDVDGLTWAVGGTVVDLGEVVAMPGVDIPLGDGWQVSTVEPSEVARTRGGQINVARLSAYRTFAGRIPGQAVAAIRGAGLANEMDMDSLAAVLRGGRRCAVIPHWKDLRTRQLDPIMVNRSAIYGYASQIPDTTNLQRGWFEGQLSAEEIPAR